MQGMDPAVRDDYLWLLSGNAQALLTKTEQDFRDKVNALTINKRLRKSVSPTQAAIVIEPGHPTSAGQNQVRTSQRTFFHSPVT